MCMWACTNPTQTSPTKQIIFFRSLRHDRISNRISNASYLVESVFQLLFGHVCAREMHHSFYADLQSWNAGITRQLQPM